VKCANSKRFHEPIQTWFDFFARKNSSFFVPEKTWITSTRERSLITQHPAGSVIGTVAYATKRRRSAATARHTHRTTRIVQRTRDAAAGMVFRPVAPWRTGGGRPHGHLSSPTRSRGSICQLGPRARRPRAGLRASHVHGSALWPWAPFS
jgi:hypothetical protein